MRRNQRGLCSRRARPNSLASPRTERRIWLPFLLFSFLLALAMLSACSGGAARVSGNKIALNRALVDFGENNLPDGSKTSLAAVKVADKDKPDGLASALYDLSLDAACEKPVTVTLPVSGQRPEGEKEAVLMLGLGLELTREGGTDIVYRYVPATEQNGAATATFTPSDFASNSFAKGATSGAASFAYGERLKLGLFYCSTHYSQGGHFMVYFPAQPMTLFINYRDRTALLDDLEAVYNAYLNKGYAYAMRTQWPLEVTIQSLDQEGCYSYGYGNGADGSIYLNRKFFAGGYQASSVKPLLMHEFFHFVQLNYVTSSTDNIWFDEATATYFESIAFSSTPSIVSEYEDLIYTGVFPQNNTSQEGYARMPLISFLAGQLGEGFIHNAYETAGAGADWDSALLSSIGPAARWAPDFYEALALGKVGIYAPHTYYKNITDGSLAKAGKPLALAVPGKEEITRALENEDAPQLGSITLSTGPFGAQLVAFSIDELNRERLEDGADPQVRVGGNAHVCVLAIRNTTATVLGSGQSVTLADFKKASKEGTLYLAVVTGLHETGVQSCELTVELPAAPTLDELVGSYEDGLLRYDTVFVSDALKAQVQEAVESAAENSALEGCDIDTIYTIEQMEATETPVTIIIDKTGENTGRLLMVGKDAEQADAQPILFTYENGLLILQIPPASDQQAKVSGEFRAAYGPDRTVTLSGKLRAVFEEVPEEDFYMDISITGSKDLE